MKVSDVINQLTGSRMISRSTIYAHVKNTRMIDDDTYQHIKQRWHNGRWHYKRMLTVEDIVLTFNISRHTVYRLLRSKRLTSVKRNNQYFVSKRNLADFIRKVCVKGDHYDDRRT